MTQIREVLREKLIMGMTRRHVVMHLLPGKAQAVIGMRRSGKTTFLHQVMAERMSAGMAIAHLEDAFLVRGLWMEADSERQRMVNPRKSYPVDPALIPLHDRTGRANTGHALETAILLELERRRATVTWVKAPDGGEVDFLARFPDGREALIQVCANASAPETAQREIAALQSAATRHPRAARHLITLTGREITIPVPDGIQSTPAWRWLLEDPMYEGR